MSSSTRVPEVTDFESEDFVNKDIEMHLAFYVDGEHFINEGTTLKEFVDYFMSEVSPHIHKSDLDPFVAQLNEAEHHTVFFLECTDTGGAEVSIMLTKGPGTTPLDTTVH